VPSYDVIIIGSGIGGLTCGAFLAKHGKKVLIVEQHRKPGGAVTSFTRNGFTFDVPSVVGSMSPGIGYGRILSELGIFDKLEFIRLEKLYHLVYPDLAVDCYADADRYHAELESLFPSERRGLERYFTLLAKLMQEMRDSYYAPGPLQILQYPFRFPHIKRYAGIRFQDFLDRMFSDVRLKSVLSGGWEYLGLPPGRLSALYMLVMYQSYFAEGTYAPRGGYQKMAEAFAAAFRGFGGELRLSSPVRRIAIVSGRAAGVVLDDGEEIFGNVVVSNADVKRTFLELVGKERLPVPLLGRVAGMEMSGSGLTVHLGVRTQVPEKFNCGTVFVNPSWKAVTSQWDAYVNDEIAAGPGNRPFAFEVRSLADPSHAPAGCHAVRIMSLPLSSRYAGDWVRDDPGAYRDLKKRLQDDLVAAAEQVLPGLSESIIVSDVSTPRTYERYLWSTGGAWYDAACTPEQVGLRRMPSRTMIPGLYLTGAKTFPGPGIVAAIESGVCTADILLDKQLLGGRYSFRD
jgi:all-trans-retinol 13,14-reductase